jgi:acyl-CoA synthetase (AMP-forming)/AMP-acid ligase II/carboxylesterase type B
MMANLATILADTAQRYGDRPAVRLDDVVLTYAELDAQSRVVAGLLTARGVAPGDRVGLMLPNVLPFPTIYYGILRAGAVVVPMNPLLKAREVEHYLGDSGATLVFAWRDAVPEARLGATAVGSTLVEVGDDWPAVPARDHATADLVPRAESDTAVILYTSGTTGKPKGAQLSHANLTTNVEITSRTLLGLTPDDVIIGCLPLFHSFGQVLGLNASVHSGSCLTMVTRFDAGKVLEVIRRDRVTVFEGVPTMYAALLQHPDRAHGATTSVRCCVSGGAALPVEILRSFEEAFGTMILEGYGLSETSPVASFNHPDRPRKVGSIGTPIEGVEMRVVDTEGQDLAIGEVGEIAIRGHNVMTGYWGNPTATAEAIPDGWFRSGDLARMDEDGYFYIVDRKKDMILRGGYNIYPREVEDVLYEHPAVVEAAVIGRPHPELGEEVVAAVALSPGATAAPQELIDFVKKRLAAYKYPREVFIVDALPKTATGEILRREVRPPSHATPETSEREPAEMTVGIRSGKIRGRVERGVARFLGIPYAAAPFGENRFRAPAPAPTWDGVRDAYDFGPTAPKGGFAPPLDRLLPDPAIPGDACLNLNVWAPSPAGSARPVMVFVHGGSLRNGSSAVPTYDGHAFARDGVVLVSVNYRLGVEGFAIFPDAPANRGLLDLIAGLTWVRDNIAVFGGDPTNITVFGESAGAICIGALLVSPRAKGLFRRAVMQSGPPLAVTPDAGAQISTLIAKRLSIAATAAAFADVDRDRLLAAQVEETRRGNPLLGGAGFAVVVDGDVIPTDPMTALRAGAAGDIDLLIGYNSEEYRLWFVPSGLINRINALTLRLALAKFHIKGRVAKVYRSGRPKAKPGEILGCIATDMLIRVPAHRVAEGRAANTFMYEFAWPTPVENLGACHALELGFVFDTLDRPETMALSGADAPQSLAEAMHQAWVAFATTGNPGWTAYDSSRPVMRFALPQPAVVRRPRDEELSLWP